MFQTGGDPKQTLLHQGRGHELNAERQWSRRGVGTDMAIGTSTPATTVVGGAPIGGAEKGVVGASTTSTS